MLVLGLLTKSIILRPFTQVDVGGVKLFMSRRVHRRMLALTRDIRSWDLTTAVVGFTSGFMTSLCRSARPSFYGQLFIYRHAVDYISYVALTYW